ncbi:MAG TPA: hypothetical protein VKG05_06895 [Steroidobacteraceae bacterium]|nr:hypothetical protein [Steroidobacteraceae bacterium]
MITVFSERHLLRNVRTKLSGGELIAPHERPERARIVREGGYAVAEIGVNAVNVLTGFEDVH